MRTKQKYYLLTVLLLAIIMTPLLLHIHKLLKIESNWHQNDISFKQISLDTARQTLTELGI